MNNEFEYIIKAVKNIKLSENERAEMRASLLENFAPSKIEEYQKKQRQQVVTVNRGRNKSEHRIKTYQ